MQLTKTEKFNYKKVEELISNENKFITDLFSILALPNRDEEEETENISDTEPSSKRMKLGKASRANSISELQQRLQAITSKKKLTYKEKLEKKGIKNRMKKKHKQGERNVQQKQIRAQKVKVETNTNEPLKTAKPVFNSEGKMVFSKFDFSDLGKQRKQRKEKDPQKILENLEKQKEQFSELVEKGEINKAVEIKEKYAWKNALAKAEGEKVKDDPDLLKKSVQRKEQKKKSSKKKWEARIEGVNKAKEERQKKRTDNIAKRKKDKKTNKLKKAVKRGKIIPGF